MSKLKLAALAVVALAVSTPASATSFIEDWEDTDFGASPGYTILQSYSGWNNTTNPPGSGGIEIQFNNIAGLAHSGENLVELDSTLNSMMTFGTPLDAGSYVLNFWYSDRPNVGAASNGISVLLNATNILSVLGGNGGSGTVWNLKTVNFTANAGDTLSFAALGSSDSLGGYIDDLELSTLVVNPNVGGVPEPTTWALMFLGFAAIGGALRSSRRRLAALTA